jgi:integrase/recombinase XerC
MPEPTIRESINAYLESVVKNRSLRTSRAYRVALNRLASSLSEQGIDVDAVSASQTSEEWIVDFFRNLKGMSASTENLYFWAIVGWRRYLASEKLAAFDVEELKLLTRPYRQKYVRRTEHPPDYYDISRLVDYAANLTASQVSSEHERLRLLRDRALIVTLADTGLDVSAVCELRRGNIDWRSHRFLLSRKGGGQRRVSFTPRMSAALLDYLNSRAPFDGAQSRSQNSLPVFASHRPRDTAKVLPLKSKGIRKAVSERAHEALGIEYAGGISPKSLRHYHKHTLLQPVSSLHPKVCDRCQVLFENGQYDDAIFNAMKVVEEQVRSSIAADPSDIGVDLIGKAMGGEPPLISFSSIPAEQQAVHLLFRGAIGRFKNPHSHRFVGVSEPMQAFECLALASLLMRMLDEAN